VLNANGGRGSPAVADICDGLDGRRQSLSTGQLPGLLHSSAHDLFEHVEIHILELVDVQALLRKSE
jgi:hypothetical protein